jgi:DNA-binding transcriptional LysR family regulator
MDVGLRHLQFVVAAVRFGSLRRAAEALDVRQSTVGRALRNQREPLGIVVFTLSSGGVRPTTG